MNQQLRRALRHVPFARAANNLRVRNDLRIIEAIPAYAPNSAGHAEVRSAMALRAATQSLELLGQLADQVEARELRVASPLEFLGTQPDSAAVTELDDAFRRHGSDKSIDHDYHLVYAGILATLPGGCGLLEVGLGTNNEGIVSTMGRRGRPGASLRAFREYLPTSDIYGADIDRDILFEDDRIKTFWVDQTLDASVRELEAKLPSDLYLIIDDGLHSPNANIQILSMALRIMPVNGWLVIEDIHPAAQSFWRVTAALLPENFEATLVRAKGGDMFVVRRSA